MSTDQHVPRGPCTLAGCENIAEHCYVHSANASEQRERAEQAEANNADLIARYEAERAPLAARVAKLETVQSRLSTWVHVYGAELNPPGVDTYGEGVRDSKVQFVPGAREASPVVPVVSRFDQRSRVPERADVRRLPRDGPLQSGP